MSKKYLLPFAAIGILVSLGGCYNNSYNKLYPATPAVCDTTSITYLHDIAPIIAANCYGAGTSCHNTGGISGFDYTTYSGVVTNIISGALLNDINFTPLRGNNNMPKDANKLAQCDINKITRWINEGYPDN